MAALVEYLADGNPEIDAMMAAVAALAPGGMARRAFVPASLRPFPESAALADRAVDTARHPSALKAGQAAKRALYWAQYNWARRHFAENPGRIAMAWNGITSSRLAWLQGARDAGAGTLYMERSPLPGRVTLDARGVNWLNSVPRSRAAFEAWAAEDPARRGDGWRRLKAALIARPSARADVGQGQGNLPGRFVFCPLQVPGDTQIRQFAGWIGSVERQIAAMCSAAMALPDGWHLRIKEHPSARVTLAAELRAAMAQTGAGTAGKVIVDNATDTFAQVAASDAVLTINSSVGLQAFFFDRPVMVMGQAYFDQPGLTTRIGSEPQLREAFACPEAFGFDPALRAIFMNWLDREYYPAVEMQPDKSARVDPRIAAARIAEVAGPSD